MGRIKKFLHRQPDRPEPVALPVKPRPPIPEQYLNLPDHTSIEPAENAPELIGEIDEMLSENKGLTEAQFVEFTDKLIGAVGGFHHKLYGGKQRLITAEIGRKPGDAIVIDRQMGDWSGTDVSVSKIKQINKSLSIPNVLMLEERLNLFSYDPDMPSFISRRIYNPIPLHTPKGNSMTGETIDLFRTIKLDEKKDLRPQELHAVASDVMDFYAATVNPPSETDQ